MDLDSQIHELVDNAPQDGVTPALVEAIAPALKQFASQLQHLQYYVLQTLSQNWAVTVLEHQTEAGLEKQVVYAFSTLKDASNGPVSIKDPDIIALPVPVIQILFQLAVMEGVYSAIFFETPGNAMIGTEIRRVDVQALIQSQLKETPSTSSSIPPNIA